MAHTLENLEIRLENLEEKFSKMEAACCSKATIEADERLRLELIALNRNFSTFTSTAKLELAEIQARQNKLEKYVYIGLGMLALLNIIGVDGLSHLLKG